VHEGQRVRVAPVKLGRNVWLGRGVIVLPGVSIGDHAVIAAGSVVFSDVPAREVWRGNPAAYVKPVRASEGFVRP
jgi:acetyltransferase-like isoleucine patch superfamily enzyme